MRHVDHAHHAEGDGEADGGEEVDRGERQRIERQVGELVQRERATRWRASAASAASVTAWDRFGIDLVEAVGGEGGRHVARSWRRGHAACGFQRLIGGDTGGLGVQLGHRDARHRTVHDVGDQRRAALVRASARAAARRCRRAVAAPRPAAGPPCPGSAVAAMFSPSGSAACRRPCAPSRPAGSAPRADRRRHRRRSFRWQRSAPPRRGRSAASGGVRGAASGRG